MTQTFLPFADFEKCAKTLDNRRLMSSINEGYEAYHVNIGSDCFPSGAKFRHKKHCIHRLWKGSERALADYLYTLREEAVRRGMKPQEIETVANLEGYKKPYWLGSETFHKLYRRHLMAKNPGYYIDFFDVSPISGYIAPDMDGGHKIYSSGYFKQEEKEVVHKFLVEVIFEK
jgi:hypothetical protein